MATAWEPFEGEGEEMTLQNTNTEKKRWINLNRNDGDANGGGRRGGKKAFHPNKREEESFAPEKREDCFNFRTKGFVCRPNKEPSKGRGRSA